MPATRTQVYFTAEQREGLDRRARLERKTLAHIVRDAVDRHLAGDLDTQERDRALADTFGACPDLGARVPSRDEWAARGSG